MKVLSRIDGSVCGAILSTRPSATRAAVSSRQKLRDDRPPRAPASQCRREQTRGARSHGSHCPQTASWLQSTFLPAPSRRSHLTTYTTLPCRQRIQRYSHATAAAAAVGPRSDHLVIQRKQDLLDFVDSKDVGTVEEHLEIIRDPFLNRYAQPEPPRLTISERREDNQYPSFQEALRGDNSLTQLATSLSAAVSTRLRHPGRISLDTIFNMYSALPEPRMIQIPAHLRHRLLTAFGTPKKKDSQTMLRYFSLIGEVRDCGLSLRRNEWNHALSFASRYVGKTTETEAEAALQLWKEMERQAKVPGNDVTFNILFDAASKSGNFQLAELIYKEMETRKIPFNRYHHVSLIHFFGLKHDADGVRAAYKEMVEAGEMVDTVVLNCVISSLLRCGEDEAALRVYEHMKATHSKAASLPDRDYVAHKMVNKVLGMFTKVGKKHPELRAQLQELADTTPDIRTYRALINHFAIKAGNLNKVAQFLDEMKWFEVPVHGSIFLMLFKGFNTHGGLPGSEWSNLRLHNVLSALTQALDEKSGAVYLDTWLMMWALRAFMRCTNKETVLDVYEQFKQRWRLEEDRAQFMDAYINNLLAGRDSAVYKESMPTRKKVKAVRKRPV
ncbi:pentatricopeptide repeat protein [Colletotrichum truncatum]|uniref:Pentatricopeptide repeat protein n=1 Tax=Colletotrichum truncatum TaxID=5467 RepID=A0ACC3ZBU4_COLTU|nr:pentatricopeptide repeat protein [Colletotrichum truncatum]KAF6783804.1 pentatricopeptide repeat protein [Colletotrichum truncatum]